MYTRILKIYFPEESWHDVEKVILIEYWEVYIMQMITCHSEIVPESRYIKIPFTTMLDRTWFSV